TNQGGAMAEGQNWKGRLQSQTVRSLVLAAIVTCAHAFVAVSGVQIDVAGLEMWSDIGLQVLADGVTLSLIWRAYRGRLKADTPIKKLPWREEIKTITNKGDRP